jgi:ribosomal subunit interface protein
MNINVEFHNLESTEPLKQYIETKLKSLERFVKPMEREAVTEGILYLSIERTTRHHHKGDVYKVSASLDIPKKKLQASRQGSDVRAVFGEVRDILKSSLEKEKERRAARTKKR